MSDSILELWNGVQNFAFVGSEKTAKSGLRLNIICVWVISDSDVHGDVVIVVIIVYAWKTLFNASLSIDCAYNEVR